MEWKYVKKLWSPNLVEEYEKHIGLGFEFPLKYKEWVPKHSGGRPSSRCFVTVSGVERVLKTFLSFNRDDAESVWRNGGWVFSRYGKHFIPFAVDNFGNYICFDAIGTVVFVSHDPLGCDVVAYSFEDFLNSLY